ncbi:protein of unknown function [Nitrosotalea devaniterrae]|uniref:Uncharacterized protein n=1 Tax=Nitrosotalea devaniterrae TaxID=1078905 RepID=A0A128A2N4_9ARCH|nr:protein of unknown function [Candidatus Nitrosotalea devanaterra]
MLFQNYDKKTMSSDQLLLNCCDTALGDLTTEKVEEDLILLEDEKLIVNLNEGTAAKPIYQITSGGILHVRQNLIKPILDLVQRDDFKRISISCTNSEPLVSALELMRSESSLTNGEFEKPKFSSKVVEYAINHAAPVVDLINNILKIM